MRDSLRSTLPIRRLGTSEQRFNGELAVKEFERLRGLLCNDSGLLQYQLAFSIAANAFVRVSGELRGSLLLRCQRSLEAFAWPLAIHVRTVLVASEAEEQHANERDDVRICPNGEITILDLIEDEILLALPVVAVNPQATMPDNAAAEPNDKVRNTPFAVLESWHTK